MKTSPSQEIFGLKGRRLLLGILFIAAFLARIPFVKDPPPGFHTGRQYHSFLVARGIYGQANPSLPASKQELARATRATQLVLEPPFTEVMAAALYKIYGRESMPLARLVPVFFWLLGGLFFYRIASRLVSGLAPWTATAFYLFFPYTVLASTSFQPDSMMICFFLAGLERMMLWTQQQSHKHLLAAASVGALAVLVKPYCVFPLGMVALMILGKRFGFKRVWIRPELLLSLFVTLLPAGLYYLHPIFTGGFLKYQVQVSVLPHYWLEPLFWKKWLDLIGNVAGYSAFGASLIGLWLAKEKITRLVLAGLWLGYFVFGMAYTFQIRSHDYVHMMLIPIISFSLLPLIQRLYFRGNDIRFLLCILISLVLLAAAFQKINKVRRPYEMPDFDRRVRVAQEIGEAVHHSPRTFYLNEAWRFGKLLSYYGEIAGLYWPDEEESRKESLARQPRLTVWERFRRMTEIFRPDFFIVTSFKELERQQDLKEFLSRQFPVYRQTGDYVIYDLRRS